MMSQPALQSSTDDFLSYSSFIRELHSRGATERIPLNAVVEVTRRCNLRCARCSSGCLPEDSELASQELSVGEYSDLFDQFAKAGCLWLMFTGGEPFLRPDFLDIYVEARKRGFIITILSNGTRISPRLADGLAEYPPQKVKIWLHGDTKERYEAVTQVPGSYSQCLDGIRLLEERGVPAGLEAPDESGLYHPFCGRRPASDVNSSDCGAGTTRFSLDPYGAMHLCPLSPTESFDLRQGSFEEGWQALAGFQDRNKSLATEKGREKQKDKPAFLCLSLPFSVAKPFSNGI